MSFEFSERLWIYLLLQQPFALLELVLSTFQFVDFVGERFDGDRLSFSTILGSNLRKPVNDSVYEEEHHNRKYLVLAPTTDVFDEMYLLCT
jgi:hypothetical protein